MPQKSPHIHWLYLWLAIAATGNILGLASLADNVVVWADFFKHIIELYRDYIRAPIAWIGNHLWPFGKLPGWVFDIIIIWMLFVASINIGIYSLKRRTMILSLKNAYKSKRLFREVMFVILSPILLPLGVLWAAIFPQTQFLIYPILEGMGK